eukprot:CFRG4098T1
MKLEDISGNRVGQDMGLMNSQSNDDSSESLDSMIEQDDGIAMSEKKRTLVAKAGLSNWENLRITVVGKGPLGVGMYEALKRTSHEVVLGLREQSSGHVEAEDSGIAILKAVLRADGSVAKNVEYMPVTKALAWADMVILAIPATSHSAFVEANKSIIQRRSKSLVVVDVSNGDRSRSTLTKAEILDKHCQTLDADCAVSVVKAFNTISAYTLQQYSSPQGLAYGTSSTNDKVLICGDDRVANKMVASMAQDMGMHPVQVGGLSDAGLVEQAPLSSFKKWTRTIAVVTVIFILYFIYTVLWYIILEYPYVGKMSDWKHMPTDLLNKVVANTALTTFAVVYMPGNLLNIYKLVVPGSSMVWGGPFAYFMSIRKQLGLLSSWLIVLHATKSSFVMFAANKFYPYFTSADAGWGTPMGDLKMNEWGEALIMTGVWAAGFFIPICVCSLPSVAASMTWKEWHLINSWVGNIALALSTTHAMVSWMAYNKCPGACPGEFMQPLSHYPGLSLLEVDDQLTHDRSVVKPKTH